MMSMVGMLFVLAALVVLFTGMGSIMLIGTKMRQNIDARTLPGGPESDSIRRLATAVESLQEQVSDLSDRLDFTERLLEAPKDEGSGRAGPPDR